MGVLGGTNTSIGASGLLHDGGEESRGKLMDVRFIAALDRPVRGRNNTK